MQGNAPAGSQHFETTLPMTFNGNFFNVEIVGEWAPTRFGFNAYKKGVKPADLK